MTTIGAKSALSQVQIWERLQVVIGEAGREGTYTCRVSDIKGDRLLISRPVFEYGHSLLADNRIVSVRFTRADAAYSFLARIKETEPKSSDAMYLLDLGEVRRLQRRRFVRLDFSMAVQYTVVSRPLREPVALSGERFVATRSVNLSAGGVLIFAEQDIKADSVVLLSLSDGRLKRMPTYVVTACRQLRAMENKQGVAGLEFILKEDLHRHFTGAELAFIPEEAQQFDGRMQNDLVRELFGVELSMRQRGIAS